MAIMRQITKLTDGMPGYDPARTLYEVTESGDQIRPRTYITSIEVCDNRIASYARERDEAVTLWTNRIADMTERKTALQAVE